MSPQPVLDHLILFLPADPSTSLPKIPDFIAQNFTLTSGGTHADGLTSNILILLADGCYIELITFVPSAPPALVPTHWWSYFSSHQGWADWCLTNGHTPAANYRLVQASHQEPQHGGRKRADGVHVQWAVTFPKGENGGQASRGRVPFFCHDVTERRVRVPLSKEKTTHPSGALGVCSLAVLVKDTSTLESMRPVYAALFGNDGVEKDGAIEFGAGRAELVDELDGMGGAKIVLRVAKDEAEKSKVEERGFWYGNVVLWAKAEEMEDAGKGMRLDGKGNDVGGLSVEYV